LTSIATVLLSRERADACDERQKVLDLAFEKLERIITKGVKESMKTKCQDSVLRSAVMLT
jgi:transcription elongation factor SPT6